jgi:hypothetical protein
MGKGGPEVCGDVAAQGWQEQLITAHLAGAAAATAAAVDNSTRSLSVKHANQRSAA